MSDVSWGVLELLFLASEARLAFGTPFSDRDGVRLGGYAISKATLRKLLKINGRCRDLVGEYHLECNLSGWRFAQHVRKPRLAMEHIGSAESLAGISQTLPILQVRRAQGAMNLRQHIVDTLRIKLAKYPSIRALLRIPRNMHVWITLVTCYHLAKGRRRKDFVSASSVDIWAWRFCAVKTELSSQQANLTASSSAVVIWQVPSKLSPDTAHSISWWRKCMTLAMAICATRKVVIMSDHRHPPHIPSATLGNLYEGAVRIFSITSGLGVHRFLYLCSKIGAMEARLVDLLAAVLTVPPKPIQTALRTRLLKYHTYSVGESDWVVRRVCGKEEELAFIDIDVLEFAILHRLEQHAAFVLVEELRRLIDVVLLDSQETRIRTLLYTRWLAHARIHHPNCSGAALRKRFPTKIVNVMRKVRYRRWRIYPAALERPIAFTAIPPYGLSNSQRWQHRPH
ncbi:hypothetical protein KC323_g268 [Hortaea werneckii]|nr:hypothetical protein KC323_g268 [Hortaea werneckii]